jgi:hypothetical protein
MVLSFSLASTGVGILLKWRPNVNDSDIKMMRIFSLCTAALYPAYIRGTLIQYLRKSWQRFLSIIVDQCDFSSNLSAA